MKRKECPVFVQNVLLRAWSDVKVVEHVAVVSVDWDCGRCEVNLRTSSAEPTPRLKSQDSNRILAGV